MWLRKGELGPALVVHPEHIKDRLREGWVECPDPRTQPEPVVPEPVHEPESAPTAPAETDGGDIPLVSAAQARAMERQRGGRR